MLRNGRIELNIQYENIFGSIRKSTVEEKKWDDMDGWASPKKESPGEKEYWKQNDEGECS